MTKKAIPTSVVPLNARIQHASFAYQVQLCNPDAPGYPGWGPMFLWLSGNAYLASIYPHAPANMTAELYSATAREFREMSAHVTRWLNRHCESDALTSAPHIIGISPVSTSREIPAGLSTIAL